MEKKSEESAPKRQDLESVAQPKMRSATDARAWTRQRELQHAVLLYLTVHGPTTWDELHLHFNKGITGEIATALYHLAQWMHVTVEDNLVRISALGTARLSAGRERS